MNERFVGFIAELLRTANVEFQGNFDEDPERARLMAQSLVRRGQLVVPSELTDEECLTIGRTDLTPHQAMSLEGATRDGTIRLVRGYLANAAARVNVEPDVEPGESGKGNDSAT